MATPGAAVALAWDPSADATVTGYNVYYGSASRTYTNVVPAGSSTSAVVSNLANGVTYFFAATTYTAAGLESDYSSEASYAVPSGNVPPTLDPLSDLIINEGAPEQVVQLTGIGSGSTNEAQTLSVNAFSSNPALIANPTVLYNSPDTTGTVTFSPSVGSFGTTVITVMVDDGAAVNNTVIRSFAVTVNPVDSPPTIDTVADVVINENSGVRNVPLTGITSGSTNANQAITLIAVSSNPNLIPNPSISYASPSSSGVLSLAPATNASGSAIITVSVTDNQPTNNFTSVSFNVTVSQTVVAPGALTNVTILPNTTFKYLINPPLSNGDKFNISLASGAPAGARITNRKGSNWLIWTPTTSQASTTNLIGIQITDTTNQALSTNQSMLVIVQDYLSLVIGSTAVQAGQGGSVPIVLASSDGVTNLTFTIPWPANTLPNPALSVSASAVTASSLQTLTNNLVINLATATGQSLQGSNVIGSINFQSLSAQPSGYISLPINTVSAAKPTSQPYVNTQPAAGQVAVVNNLPIVQPSATDSASRAITVLATTGNSYQLQYCTNFGPGAVWYPVLTYTQTNVSQNVTVDPTIPQVLYRVQQK